MTTEENPFVNEMPGTGMLFRTQNFIAARDEGAFDDKVGTWRAVADGRETASYVTTAKELDIEGSDHVVFYPATE